MLETRVKGAVIFIAWLLDQTFFKSVMHSGELLRNASPKV